MHQQQPVLKFAGLLTAALLIAGCGKHLPGSWEQRCDASLMVPDGNPCRAALHLEHSHLAIFPESDHWLLAMAWTGPEIQLIQATVDTSAVRRSVRLEDGFCAGPICWVELQQRELERMVKRYAWRIELTRIFPGQAGGTRRGTMALHATTRGLPEILLSLTTAEPPLDESIAR